MSSDYRLRRWRFRSLSVLLYPVAIVVSAGALIGFLLLLAVYVWEPLAVVLGILLFPLFAFGLTLLPDAFEQHVYGPAERRDLRSVQKKRDRWVRRHSRQLLDGEMPFCLYLRPFVSSGAVRVMTSGYEIGLSDRKGRFRPPWARTDWAVRWEDLEAILTDAIRPTGPLVALGRPGEQFGAARWKTDDDSWRDLVRQLFEIAELIFLIPSSHEGTMWELRQLLAVDRWRAKTVIIVPSTGTSFGYGGPTADASFRNGAARRPLIEVSRLRDEALQTLASVGASGAVRRAEAHESESFLMLSKKMQIALIMQFERPRNEHRRARSSGLGAEYVPSHSSAMTLRPDHVRDLVEALHAHARQYAAAARRSPPQ